MCGQFLLININILKIFLELQQICCESVIFDKNIFILIPKFDDNGYLPEGIYDALLIEYEQCFVYNVVRREIHAGLLRLIKELKTIGCKSVFIDGSFVTAKEHPNDVDVCWDDRGLDYEDVEKKMPILWDLDPPRTNQQLLYRADIFPAFIIEGGSKKMFIDFFQQIKHEEHRNKGIIKIDIV